MLALLNAARNAEGGSEGSEDRDDDLQNLLPSFFLHNAISF